MYLNNPYDIWGGEPERNADIPLSKILQAGVSFEYEYDFGSTTELILKVRKVLHSIERHTKESGPRGYLKFMEDFLPD